MELSLSVDIKSFFAGKKILITGCCGSIGKALVKDILQWKTEYTKVIGIDNNESELFFLQDEYRDQENVEFYVGDVCDYPSLVEYTTDVNVIFHLAALKHVILSEKSPAAVINTNINGVQNIVRAAKTNNVNKVIFTSSDKAVNPTSVMGTSKLMGERLMTAAQSSKGGPIFASTRFGNVLGSNGSVIQIFKKQLLKHQNLTLTHREMSRFVMTSQQAVDLVLKSALLAMGGEVFVTKMPTLSIYVLAKALINEYGPRYGFDPSAKKIEEIGVKAGEKLYEELMSSEEVRRAVEIDDYFVILPAFGDAKDFLNNHYNTTERPMLTDPYISRDQEGIGEYEIISLLHSGNLLN